MICTFSIKDAKQCGDLLVSQYRLRHRIFCERLGYSVSSCDGLEFDQFDNPRTEYLVWADSDRRVLAMTRLYPTTSSYMLEEYWPHIVGRDKIPKSEKILEGSRLCLDDAVVGAERDFILDRLVEAILKIGLAQRLSAIVGVMQPKVWRSVFESRGWPVQYLGDAAPIKEGELVLAGQLIINPEITLVGKCNT